MPLVTQYTFNPTAGTITFTGLTSVDPTQVGSIADVTLNKVLYSGGPGLSATGNVLKLPLDTPLYGAQPTDTLDIYYGVDTGGATSSSGSVASVFGRTGSVVATPGDYTAAQVGALSASDDLSAIATANPTAANVAMNNKKFTGLANGTSSTDSAAFGQIPTALPPNGSAGGDLTGTYPNPTVAKVNGTSLASLTTGLLKNTTGTGVPSIAVAGTDYVTPSGNLGTPASGTLTNCTGLPVGGISTTGTPSSSTVLYGNGAWSTPPGSTGFLTPARVATVGTETFTISSGSVTQISGTTIDGVSPSVGDRIVIKDAPTSTGTGSAYSAKPANGLYTVTANTTNLSVSRTTDFSGSVIPAGLSVMVMTGTANGGSCFTVTTPSSSSAFTYGTGNITWTDVSATVITPEMFGAKGDGTTDDSTALQNCFNAAAGKTVLLNPAKNYVHTTGSGLGSVLVISTSNVTVTGGGTLTGSVPSNQALTITGNYVSLIGITLAATNVTTRLSTFQNMKLWLNGCSYFYARDVYINGSSAAGVYFEGVTHSHLEHVRVYNTKADGYYITNVSSDIYLDGCVADTTGDYGFTVVSYATDSGPTSNVITEGCRSYNSAAGGFDVVGGDRVQHSGFLVDSPQLSGLEVIADNGTYRNVTNTFFHGGTIINANQSAGGSYAAILLYGATSATVQYVNFSDIVVRNTNAAGSVIAVLQYNTSTVEDIGYSNIATYNFTGTYFYNTTGTLTRVYYNNIQVDGASTNTRVTKRVVSVNTPGATPSTNTDVTDVAYFGNLNAAITSMTTNLTGTPVAGDTIQFQFIDNGTARAITWGSKFESSTVSLPTTTVISTLLTVNFVWNTVTSKWRVLQVA